LGIYEKDIVLSITLLAYKYLKKHSGITVILTRRNDRFLDLEERATIANSGLKHGGKGLFVSIHVNYSIFNRQSSGIETFYYSPKPYSEKEKKILKYRLRNISRVYYNGKLQWNNLQIASRMLELKLGRMSRVLAKNIQNAILTNVGRRVQDRGIKQDRFFVLAHTVMPSVLLELGFLSNRVETKRLMTREYQKLLAKGIAEGIIRYIKNSR
jgi:N-acetylmuramoyl-L-alanine amidase